MRVQRTRTEKKGVGWVVEINRACVLLFSPLRACRFSDSEDVIRILVAVCRAYMVRRASTQQVYTERGLVEDMGGGGEREAKAVGVGEIEVLSGFFFCAFANEGNTEKRRP